MNLPDILNNLKQSATSGFEQSPMKAILTGRLDQVAPRVAQIPKWYSQHPPQVAFGGEMEAVNPGGFAGALGGFSGVKGTTEPVFNNAMRRHGMATNPDLTIYEDAFNNGITEILDQLHNLHPTDPRFAIHLGRSLISK